MMGDNPRPTDPEVQSTLAAPWPLQAEWERLSAEAKAAAEAAVKAMKKEGDEARRHVESQLKAAHDQLDRAESEVGG